MALLCLWIRWRYENAVSNNCTNTVAKPYNPCPSAYPCVGTKCLNMPKYYADPFIPNDPDSTCGKAPFDVKADVPDAAPQLRYIFGFETRAGLVTRESTQTFEKKLGASSGRETM